MFKPSEVGSFSPYSMLVDVSKYPNLPKDAKDILYRPPRVKILYEKYWALVKQVHGREKKENDEELI